MRRLCAICTTIVALLVAGCTYPVNPRLGHYDPSKGYRYETLSAPVTNSEETFVILTFSGGGTRAAALAYGVIDQLRTVRIGDGQRTLLDEVDVISSVSGGSFAAAYYGLFGQDAFMRDFKEHVLHRKIQRDLILRVLAPWNWPWLLSPYYGRGDLADDYYDRNIFSRRTYADMPRQRPYIVLNATDISEGAQFSFSQEHFDRLCSDLDGVRVSRGVTASSAFPVAFSPLTVKNYPKESCAYQAPAWVHAAIGEAVPGKPGPVGDFESAPQRYDRAANWISYEDAQRRPFLHLMDGGLADNIGLRGPEFAITTSDSPWSLLTKANNDQVKRIIVIVADAKPETEPEVDRSARPPGVITVLNASATNPMENYSSDTVELLRDRFREWKDAARNFDQRVINSTALCEELANELCKDHPARNCTEETGERCRAKFVSDASDRTPTPTLYRIHVRFAALKDPALRQRVQQVPTSLQLPDEDVELVIQSAHTLLSESQEYQRLLKDVATEAR